MVRSKCMHAKKNIPKSCQESFSESLMQKSLKRQDMPRATVYLSAAQPRVLRLDFTGPAGPFQILPLTFFLLRCRPRSPSSGPSPSVSKLAPTHPTRLSRRGGCEDWHCEVLHAARPNHCAPHMLRAQKLALWARKLFQARHRDGSTWASPRGCGAGGVPVLSPHGECGDEVGAPSVGCAAWRSHACQTILISWGAGVRPWPRCCWPLPSCYSLF